MYGTSCEFFLLRLQEHLQNDIAQQLMLDSDGEVYILIRKQLHPNNDEVWDSIDFNSQGYCRHEDLEYEYHMMMHETDEQWEQRFLFSLIESATNHIHSIFSQVHDWCVSTLLAYQQSSESSNTQADQAFKNTMQSQFYSHIAKRLVELGDNQHFEVRVQRYTLSAIKHSTTIPDLFDILLMRMTQTNQPTNHDMELSERIIAVRRLPPNHQLH